MNALVPPQFKKSKKVLLFCGVILTSLLIAVPLVLYVKELREPQYNLRSISYWLDNCVVSKITPTGGISHKLNKETEHAVASLGKESIPYLKQSILRKSMFSEHDSSFRKIYENVWRSLPRKIQVKLPPPSICQIKRTFWIMLIRQLGNDGEQMIPVLINELKTLNGSGGNSVSTAVIRILHEVAKGTPHEEKAMQSIVEFRDRLPPGSGITQMLTLEYGLPAPSYSKSISTPDSLQ